VRKRIISSLIFGNRRGRRGARGGAVGALVLSSLSIAPCVLARSSLSLSLSLSLCFFSLSVNGHETRRQRERERERKRERERQGERNGNDGEARRGGWKRGKWWICFTFHRGGLCSLLSDVISR